MMIYPQFPKNFVFGAASAAYQVEGAWDKDGRGPSIWDDFCHKGKTINKDNADIACDTYNDFMTDVGIMKRLHLSAYRFSISWSRIMPTGRYPVNRKGLDYYNRLVDGLLENGIEPFITLYHWDMPLALYKEMKGFASRECAHLFAEYCEVVVKDLGDRVKNWMTLNEPWEHGCLGHFLGEHAPGIRNPWTYFKVAHFQLLAHGLGTERIKSLSPDSHVGIVLNLTPIHPLTRSEKDIRAARMGDQFMNRFFLDAIFKGRYPEPLWSTIRLIRPKVSAGEMETISTPIDFLGLNNYSREHAYHAWYVPLLKLWITGQTTAEKEFVKNGVQYTAMGWEVYPDGLYECLMRIKKDYGNPPVYITENGAAFTDVVRDGKVNDPLRQDFLNRYMSRAADAAREGANLKGYFVWSLTDNFEWAAGFEKKFGLTHVDYNTQQRLIKQSGYWYQQLIRHQTAS